MAVKSEDTFFEDVIMDDDDNLSDLFGDDDTSTFILSNILKTSEAGNLSEEDIKFLKQLKERLGDVCVPADAQERLSRLNILITWTVPVQQTLESNVSSEVANPRNLLKEINKMNLDVNMDTSKFTEDEDEEIHSRWNQFSREYNFKDPNYIVAFTRFGGVLPKDQRVKFAQYLGKNLPNRFLCSILHRFSLLHGMWKKKKYTKEEDDILLNIQEKNFLRNKGLVSSIMLNRTAASISSRKYHTSTPASILYGKKKRKWRGFRDDELLIVYLMRKTNSKTLADLQTKNITIKDFMGAASKLRCSVVTALGRWKYQLSTQLFATGPLYKYDLIVRLIEWFKGKDYEEWNKIEWPEVIAAINNATKPFLTALFKSVVLKHTEYSKSYRYDLRTCVNYLHKNVLPVYQNMLSDDIKIHRYRLNRAGYLVAIR